MRIAPASTSRLSASCSSNALRIFVTRRDTMNRVTNGAARPASRPQSDWKTIATTSERDDPADDRPAGDRECGELEAAELDVGLEPLPPALAADRALRGVGEHRRDLGATQARLLLGRDGHVGRHAAPERAVANVDRGEDGERDERENRDDDEDHEPRRRDDLVDQALLERALRREVEWRASCSSRLPAARPGATAVTLAFTFGGRSER